MKSAKINVSLLLGDQKNELLEPGKAKSMFANIVILLETSAFICEIMDFEHKIPCISTDVLFCVNGLLYGWLAKQIGHLDPMVEILLTRFPLVGIQTTNFVT